MPEFTILRFIITSLSILIICMYLSLVVFTYITLKEPMTSTDKEYKELYDISFVRCFLIPFIVYYHTTRFIFLYGSIWYCFKKLIGFYFISYPMGLSVMYVIPKVMVGMYNKRGLTLEEHRRDIFREYIFELLNRERG